MDTGSIGTRDVTADESNMDDRIVYRHCGRSPSGIHALLNAQFVRGVRYPIFHKKEKSRGGQNSPELL